MQSHKDPKTMVPPSYDEVREEEEEEERKKKEDEKKDTCCKKCGDCLDCCCRPVSPLDYCYAPYSSPYTPNDPLCCYVKIDCDDSTSSCTSCGCGSGNCNCSGMDCKDEKVCMCISASALFVGAVALATSATYYSVKEVVVAFKESCGSGTIKTLVAGVGAAAGWFASESLANYIAAQAGPNNHPEMIAPVVKGFCASLGSAATCFISKVKCSRMGLFSSSLREPLNRETPNLQDGPTNGL